ncbi:MAG TPA: Gfo/Idh/MocA family oxidoreductase [Luteimonas sp.]|nr:Gfo/Idh/MocA family oxidoreductase [Luteimonas sp.]
MSASTTDPGRRAFVAGSALGMGALLVSGTRDAAAAVQGAALPASATGRPAPVLETPAPEPDARRLGWAVAGLGEFALNHMLPAIGSSRFAKLTALISGNPAKARDVASRHGVPPGALYDYAMQGLRDDTSVDIVYVITPNSTHPDLVIRAFEAGKHVLCEKPMANSSADCRRMIDAGKAAGRKLMIAYRAHWEPHNLELKRRIDAGELGTVHFASADHHRPLDPSNPADQWRVRKAIAGGGSLVDIGIYSLNGLIWLLGETPTSAVASMSAPADDPRFAEIENVFTAQLDFASGRRATISSGYTADRKRIDIWGDKAVGLLDPATSYKGNRLTIGDSGEQRQVNPQQDDVRQFIGEVDHFSQVVRDGGEPATPGEMGLRDVRIIEALYAAARTGKRVAIDA